MESKQVTNNNSHEKELVTFFIKLPKFKSNSNSQKRDPKNEKKHHFSITNIIGILLCIILLPGFIIATSLFINSLIHRDIPPSCFGYTPLIVETGSMSPVFNENDVILIQNSDDKKSFIVGDIICYHSGDVYVTHRIKEVTTDDNGTTIYFTQGDANNALDNDPVYQNQILGVYKTRFEGMGKTLLFIQTPTGMILCVMVPIFIVLLLFFIPPQIEARKKQNSSNENEEENSIR